jgi:hypothetical protein
VEQPSLLPADPSRRTETPIFRTAWYATDLGEYRPCRYTYQEYPYEQQAPLDAREFTGHYTWLGEPGPIDPDSAARPADLDAQLTEVGLALPADFVRFYRHDNFRYALDEASVTCCWTDLGQRPIPSPVEPGSYLVRFFRDQQDCAIWYLYLRPDGEIFVVLSHVDFEEATPEELAQWPAAGHRDPLVLGNLRAVRIPLLVGESHPAPFARQAPATPGAGDVRLPAPLPPWRARPHRHRAVQAYSLTLRNCRHDPRDAVSLARARLAAAVYEQAATREVIRAAWTTELAGSC